MQLIYIRQESRQPQSCLPAMPRRHVPVPSNGQNWQKRYRRGERNMEEQSPIHLHPPITVRRAKRRKAGKGRKEGLQAHTETVGKGKECKKREMNGPYRSGRVLEGRAERTKQGKQIT